MYFSRVLNSFNVVYKHKHRMSPKFQPHAGLVFFFVEGTEGITLNTLMTHSLGMLMGSNSTSSSFHPAFLLPTKVCGSGPKAANFHRVVSYSTLWNLNFARRRLLPGPPSACRMTASFPVEMTPLTFSKMPLLTILKRSNFVCGSTACSATAFSSLSWIRPSRLLSSFQANFFS